MKKHIDKSCLHGNNVITLIKHFIKHKIKQYKKEETIMLQQVMTNPGEIIFREVPVPEVKENQHRDMRFQVRLQNLEKMSQSFMLDRR